MFNYYKNHLKIRNVKQSFVNLEARYYMYIKKKSFTKDKKQYK